MLFPFFLVLQMWVVAALSDPTQMLSLSIVPRVVLGVVLLGWKRNSLSMFSCMKYSFETKRCSCFLFLIFFFFLAGCGTGFSVTAFCFGVCGIFSLEAPDDVPSSAIAFLPVIKLKCHRQCIYSILYHKSNTLKQNVIFSNQGCRFLALTVVPDFSKLLLRGSYRNLPGLEENV